MSKDVDMVLQPAAKVSPMEPKASPPERRGQVQAPVKVFCAKRAVAMALLEDIIAFAGAHNEVMHGKIGEDKIKKLSENTNLFLVDLGDRLMIDCGLNEKDIDIVMKRISAQLTDAEGEKKT
jgi:hypothetical protein